jgi:ATP-dependent exoDNAse (exonuclease V) alpha subunit
LRLAYACTFNKSQGQEYDRILIDGTQDTFSHGHLYVALSRAKDAANVAVFVPDKCIMTETPVLVSYCYKELLIDNP